MRFAVFADVQGNAEALQAVLADIEQSHPDLDTIVSAGDAIGRGPQPNEVVDLLRSKSIAAVRGNYEEAVASSRPDSGTDFATPREEEVDLAAVAWTRRTLTPENLAYVAGLPADLRLFPAGRGVRVERNTEDERTKEYRRNFLLRAIFGGLARTPRDTTSRVRVFHGSPRASNEFIRADTANSILTTVAGHAQADVLITAHAATAFRRDAADMTFIGVGPVTSREGSSLAEYAVVEIQAEVKADFYHVRFDAEAYRRALQTSGLPRELAEGFA